MTGLEAERAFFERMQKECKEVTRAEKKENQDKTYDVICDGVKYDVKGQKRLNREDTAYSDIVWLEFKNVRGDDGWLKGESDKIAFLRNKNFLIVDRVKLRDRARSLCKNLTILPWKEHARLYQRRGRKDIMMYVNFSDIEDLVEKTVEIEGKD